MLIREWLKLTTDNNEIDGVVRFQCDYERFHTSLATIITSFNESHSTNRPELRTVKDMADQILL